MHTSQQRAKCRRCPYVYQRQLTVANNQIGGDYLPFTLKLCVDEPQVIRQLARDTGLLHPKDSFQASPRLPMMVVRLCHVARYQYVTFGPTRRINIASQIAVCVVRRQCACATFEVIEPAMFG